MSIVEAIERFGTPHKSNAYPYVQCSKEKMKFILLNEHSIHPSFTLMSFYLRKFENRLIVKDECQ